jgi:nitric oxide reductase subunit B
MNATRKLWTWLAIICVASFAVLLWVGKEIYLTAPPIPKQVINTKGDVLYTHDQVQLGQQAWMSAGGQQLGTVWGHGSYVAPDWSADWLHREAVALQDLFAEHNFNTKYANLSAEQKGQVDALVKQELRTNTYDAKTDVLALSNIRAEAVRQVAEHYIGLFGTDPKLDKLREQYAMTACSQPQAEERPDLSGLV